MNESLKLSKLYEDLNFALEGYDQMQQPDAGYDKEDPAGLAAYHRDLASQEEAIGRLEKKIFHLIKEIKNDKQV